MILRIVVEDKDSQPLRQYTYEGKVFVYNATNCLVVSCNENVSKIYLDEGEQFTIYNY